MQVRSALSARPLPLYRIHPVQSNCIASAKNACTCHFDQNVIPSCGQYKIHLLYVSACPLCAHKIQPTLVTHNLFVLHPWLIRTCQLLHAVELWAAANPFPGCKRGTCIWWFKVWCTQSQRSHFYFQITANRKQQRWLILLKIGFDYSQVFRRIAKPRQFQVCAFILTATCSIFLCSRRCKMRRGRLSRIPCFSLHIQTERRKADERVPRGINSFVQWLVWGHDLYNRGGVKKQ